MREHWLFVFVRLQSDPRAATFVAPWAAFGPKWDVVAKQETSLLDAVYTADAAAVGADRVLNRLSDRVASAIHDGKKADLTHPLHQLFFGSSTPYAAKRPVLGAQLELQKKWPSLLLKGQKPALVALAGEAAAAVDAGVQAEGAVAAAEAAWDAFRLAGERKALFDAYNALAASTYGGLKAIVHDQPDLDLGTEWASSFYLHASRSGGPTTVAQAAAIVKRLEGELAGAQQTHAALVSQQQAAEEAAALAEKAVAAAKRAETDAKQKQREAGEALKKAKRAQKVRG
ncbi:Hypothetical protein A7982_01822 [Minicystis rosea]|nr:Hypothetical protein A7982_01822 [Minicystis rosea]